MKNKFKEASPYDTINRIRGILYKFNIMVKERWHCEPATKLYSVNLEIVGTKVGTNGKGTTEAYALASAYAELIERLTNGLLFSDWTKIGRDLFVFFPDEEKLDIDKYYSDNPIFDAIIKMFSITKGNNNFKSSKIGKIDLIREFYLEKNENKFISVYFESLFSGKTFPIICGLLKNCYGSNGMAAGNTYEEALVQAISEIFERYCMKKIVLDKISPPDIPKDILMKQFPSIYEYIAKIERQGNYFVRVRDCSLGLGFPVVGATVFDKDKQTSSTSMGAHPDIGIALERTFTELFQGRLLGESWKQFSQQENWNIFSRNSYVAKCNILSLFKDASGYYPDNFYSQKFSYLLNSNLLEQKFYSNSEMLLYLSNLCKKNDFEIFVKKSSKLGFPTVHVIIPGMSEVWDYDNDAYEEDVAFKQMQTIFTNFDKYPKDTILNTFELYDISRKFFLFDSFVTDSDKSTYQGICSSFLSMIKAYYQIGDIDKAIVFIYNIMPNVPLTNGRKMLRCLLNALETIRRGNAKKSTLYEILSNFYDTQIVDLALKVIFDTKPIPQISRVQNNAEIEKSIIINLKKYMRGC